MPHRHHGRIVVGIDGSDASIEALRWALDQAELTGALVEAVSAWQGRPKQSGHVPLYPDDLPAERAAVRLSEAIGEATTGRGPVDVVHRLVEGHPGDVLTAASEEADILVMGSRGLGRFTGALVGSVTQHCIQHADCPVVVIRLDEDRPD